MRSGKRERECGREERENVLLIFPYWSYFHLTFKNCSESSALWICEFTMLFLHPSIQPTFKMIALVAVKFSHRETVSIDKLDTKLCETLARKLPITQDCN